MLQRLILWIVILAILEQVFRETNSCHVPSHGTDRKRRDISPTIRSFFPGCLANVSSLSKAWSTRVDYVVLHSQWFNDTEIKCESKSVIAEDVKCWINEIPMLLHPDSPLLNYLVDCVVEYAFEYGMDVNEVNKAEFYGSGSKLDIDEKDCPSVSLSDAEFEAEYLADVDATGFDSDDATLGNITDLIDFMRSGVVCSNCICTSLFDDENHFEEYDYEQENLTCGSCWPTKLASVSKNSSQFQHTAVKMAVKIGNLKAKAQCSESSGTGNTSNQTMTDFLEIDIECGAARIYSSAKMCQLKKLGFEQADEIFVADEGFYNDSLVAEECRGKVTRKTAVDGHLLYFNLTYDVFMACGGFETSNTSHALFKIWFRSLTDVDTFDGQDGTKAAFEERLTCAYSHSRLQYMHPISISNKVATGHTPVTLGVYQDSKFTHEYSDSALGIMYVKIKAETSQSSKLAITDCWVSKGSSVEMTDRITLIKIGCMVDETTMSNQHVKIIQTCKSTEASFRFHAFSWSDKSPLFITCSVLIMRDDDVSDLICCNEECCNKPTRKKRSFKTPSRLIATSSQISVTFQGETSCDQVCFLGNDHHCTKCGCYDNYSWTGKECVPHH